MDPHFRPMVLEEGERLNISAKANEEDDLITHFSENGESIEFDPFMDSSEVWLRSPSNASEKRHVSFDPTIRTM